MNLVTLTYSIGNYKNKGINVPISLKCYTDKRHIEASLNNHSEQQLVRSKCLAISHELQKSLSLRLQHGSVV